MKETVNENNVQGTFMTAHVAGLPLVDFNADRCRDGQVFEVTFVDHGQDFSTWWVRDGVVIDCQPFQGSIFVGARVKGWVKVGKHLSFHSAAVGRDLVMNYPVENIVELPPQQAQKIGEYYEAWKNIIDRELP